MLSAPTKPRWGVAALAALTIASFAVVHTPQPASAASAFTLEGTHEIGGVNRTAAVDDARDRVYVIGKDPDASVGGSVIEWFDTAAGAPSTEQIALPAAGAGKLLVSADAKRLYVAHDRSGVFSIVDLDTNAVTEITDMPKFPSGIVEDTTTGQVYVYDSSGLIRVDPSAGTASAPISVSAEKYPLVKDAVYDPAGQMIWIAEGRANVLTGFSTASGSWLSSISIPVATFETDGEALGGRPSFLALDRELGELHVGVMPTFADDWEDTRIISLRLADRAYVGEPISVRENTYEMQVNEATHEIVTTDGFSNVVSVVSPDTWTATTAVDFTAAGVTSGTGAGNANVWGLGISGDGDRVYVSHPYSSQLSVISRAGDVPEPTVRDIAPGQGGETPTEETQPWEGPQAPAPSEAPAGSHSLDSGSLSWGVSGYVGAWAAHLLGDTSRDGDEFVFGEARGWWNSDTGAADVVWDGGVRIQHYPSLVPELTTTFGNPRLRIAADGTGELSFDTAWTVSNDLASEGYKRVPFATFSNATIVETADGLQLSATPDFAGRSLEIDGITYPDSYPAEFVLWLDPQMQPWWVTTGASMDKEKVPSDVSVTVVLGALNEKPGGGSDGGSDGGTDGSTGGNTGNTGGHTGGTGNPDGTAAGSGDAALASSGFDGTPLALGAAGFLLLIGAGIAAVAVGKLRGRTDQA